MRITHSVARVPVSGYKAVAMAVAEKFADPLEKAKLPLTNRDRQRKHRTNNSEQVFTLDVGSDGYADLVYLMREWGFPSRRRAMIVALKHLAQATRNGLERIDLTNS